MDASTKAVRNDEAGRGERDREQVKIIKQILGRRTDGQDECGCAAAVAIRKVKFSFTVSEKERHMV